MTIPCKPATIAAPLLAALLAFAPLLRATPAPPAPRLLKPNAGWCWFQDERAIIANGKLIFATVAGTDRDGSSPGDIQVTSCLITNDGPIPATTATLHPKYERDDHCVPALLTLPDGRLLAAYASHGNATDRKNNLMRWRITRRPGDITEWEPEQTLPVGSGATYSNLLPVIENGARRIYNFHRGIGFNPNYLVSDDDGATFTYGGRLLAWRIPKNDPAKTGLDGSRPYLKYALHPPGDMHIVTTDSHPRAYDNSLYHAFIRDGQIRHTDGRLIAPLSRTQNSPVAPNSLTRVFAGDADHVAWPCDMHVDKNGRPRILFTVQRGGAPFRNKQGAPGDGQDHRFYHALWDGSAWQVNEIAHAGSRLYAGEDDYTGLAALDPQHPGVVYISTNADPKTGAPLISAADGKRHHELYRGTTLDDGKTWTWRPLTRDSTADNIRPIVPIWPDAGERALVLWLRGTLTTFRDYNLDVVSLLDTP